MELSEEKVVESLYVQIQRYLSYVWNYRSNISNLTEQMEKLRHGRMWVCIRVDEANRQGDEVFPDVEKWLSRVKEMIKETDKWAADERKSNRWCFHLRLRYLQSQEAKYRTLDIVNQIQEANKYGIVAHPSPSSIRDRVFVSQHSTTSQIKGENFKPNHGGFER